MTYIRYSPAAPLSGYVQCLWYAQGAPQSHSKERLLPNGETSIVFNLNDEAIRVYDPDDLSRYQEFGTAIVKGPGSTCCVIETSQQEHVIGIQFRPGGAFPFFKQPASELQDSCIDLTDLWHRKTGEIHERLLASARAKEMLIELERSLLRQLLRPQTLHPAVTFALRQLPASRISDLTETIGLSSRRLIDLFHQQVGLTPKVFCRVRRFQRVLQKIHRVTEVDWVDVALDCGYYDQAHFIHDFQRFSGLTPSRYLAAATLHLNHVPITEVS